MNKYLNDLDFLFLIQIIGAFILKSKNFNSSSAKGTFVLSVAEENILIVIFLFKLHS